MKNAPAAMTALRPRPLLRLSGYALAALIVASAGAYATLPLWVPTEWIRHRISRQLTQELRRNVSLGRVSLSWSGGVQLNDLLVAGPAGGNEPHFARVARVQIPLQPLRMLLSNSLERLELSGVEVWLEIGSDGSLVNLPQPAQGSGGGVRLPHCEIRDLAFHLHSEKARQTIRMDRIECRVDSKEGLLGVHATAMHPGIEKRKGKAPPPSVFLLDAQLTLAGLRPERPFGGSIHFEWKHLALVELPFAMYPRLPFRQVEGLTSGELTIRPQADLRIEFDLRAELDGIRLVREGGPPPLRPIDAAFALRGRWDPGADQVELADFRYETRGLLLHPAGTGVALAIDTRGIRPFHVKLAGQVKDWAALGREFPEVDTLIASSGTELKGGAGFTLELLQQKHEDRVSLLIDGRGTHLSVGGAADPLVRAATGASKTFELEIVHQLQKRRLSARLLRFTLGDASLTLQSDLPLPAADPADRVGWIADLARGLSWSMVFNVPELSQLCQHIPALTRKLPLRGSGPVRVAALLESRNDRSELRVTAHAPEQTVMTVGDWLQKPAGEALDASALLTLPRAGGGLSARAEAAIGACSLSVRELKIDYRFTSPAGSRGGRAEGGSAEIEARAQLPMHIDHVERLASLCPHSKKFLAGDLQVGGAVDLLGQLDLSRRRDDWVIHSRARLRGGSLAIERRGLFEKPAAEPLNVSIEHRFSLLDGQREQFLSLLMQMRSVQVSAQIGFAGIESADPADDFEQARVTVNADDAAGALAMFPVLNHLVSPSEIHGRWRLQVEDMLVGNRQGLSVLLDATEADFRAGGESPFRKRGGVPAVVDLSWVGETDPANPRIERWTIDRGRLELGGLRAMRVEGRVTTASTGGAVRMGPRAANWSGVGPISFRDATLHVSGTAALDRSLNDISDAFRKAASEYHLSGECPYELDVHATPERVDVSGAVSADKVRFSAALNQPVVPLIRKAAGTPAGLALKAEVVRQAGREFRVRLHDASVHLADSSLAWTGVFNIADSTSTPSIPYADLKARFRMGDAHALEALFPGDDFRVQGGSCEGDLRLTREAGQTAVRSARIDFDEISIRTPGDPLLVQGSILLDGKRLLADGLRFHWGPSDATISGDVSIGEIATRGRIGIAIDHADVPDLQKRVNALVEATPGLRSADAPALNLKSILDRLRRSNLDINAAIGSLTIKLPLDVTVTADAGSMQAGTEKGIAQFDFRGLVDGGYIGGRVTTDLNAADPRFHLTYSAEKIQPGPLVDRYLALTFPGMKASGSLTLIDETDQKFFPAPGELNYPVGKGEFIIGGGTIEGRAAPEWMIKIFPGLDLASFEFSRFHSWFYKTIDGRIHHQMIYQGKYYNIYTVGYGDAEGRINYEVGIDFFADLDSKYWADSGQGRIPLFRKTGQKTPDGHLANEVVTYTPPQRVLDALLVKNNPLVTAYHAVRKRVLQAR